MSHRIPTLDIEATKQREIACRGVLLQRPEDLETRVSIAWCLLMRALYQAGVESRSDLPGSERTPSQLIGADPLMGSARSSRSLLNECLRHMCMVKQLSQEAAVQIHLAALQSLISTLGCADQIIMAEAQTASVLDRIAGDMFRS